MFSVRSSVLNDCIEHLTLSLEQVIKANNGSNLIYKIHTPKLTLNVSIK
jgi:hypothetical protein